MQKKSGVIYATHDGVALAGLKLLEVAEAEVPDRAKHFRSLGLTRPSRHKAVSTLLTHTGHQCCVAVTPQTMLICSG